MPRLLVLVLVLALVLGFLPWSRLGRVLGRLIGACRAELLGERLQQLGQALASVGAGELRLTEPGCGKLVGGDYLTPAAQQLASVADSTYLRAPAAGASRAGQCAWVVSVGPFAAGDEFEQGAKVLLVALALRRLVRMAVRTQKTLDGLDQVDEGGLR